MPKVPIDYSNTIIYKLVNYDCPELSYVGSTTNRTRRKQEHKCCVTNPNNKAYNRKVYKMIRENGGWESWHMVDIKAFPCANRREAEAEEDKIMQELKANMNSQKAHLTEEYKKQYRKTYNAEYRDTHKEQHKEQLQKYRDAHKEEIKQCNIAYRDAHKEEIKEKYKKYTEANKDKIALRKAIKITCQCGSTYRKCSKTEHERTNKHKKFMEELNV